LPMSIDRRDVVGADVEVDRHRLRPVMQLVTIGRGERPRRGRGDRAVVDDAAAARGLVLHDTEKRVMRARNGAVRLVKPRMPCARLRSRTARGATIPALLRELERRRRP